MAKKEQMVIVTFRPQAWVNDYAIDVDPKGETKFQVPLSMVIKMSSHDSDVLREHPNCPKWAKEWDGPFECSWDDLSL